MKTPMQDLIERINNKEFNNLDECKEFIKQWGLGKERIHTIAFATWWRRYKEKRDDNEEIERAYTETFNL